MSLPADPAADAADIAAAIERARELLRRVGIDPSRYGSYPHEFSGGMRQRLAIALAMALRPPLVIADEPTTSLDVAVTAAVMAELCELCREAGSSLLLISHDLAMAGRWCQRIAILDHGSLFANHDFRRRPDHLSCRVYQRPGWNHLCYPGFRPWQADHRH